MPCVACLIVTTTGRVLVQWELDTTLPFHYTQLGLLIASLFQFSKAQEYSQLELRNGYTLVACSDVISQISTVVVCKTPVAAATASSGRSCKPQMLNMARLKGLVILKEFLRCYQDQVDTILIESKADAQEMAEKYTLTSALGGMRSNDDADDGTMDVFLTFQNEFMSAILEDNSTENIRAGISDSVAKMHTTSSIEVTRQFLMNADTGSVLYSLLPAPKLPGRHCYLEDSLPTQQLLKRVAQALSYCFPILQRTSLLTRNQEDSHVGFSNPSISSTTIILRIAGDNQKDASLPPGLLHIAVQMFTTGTFASVVFFHGKNEHFLGHSNELVRSGDLQRVLLSDSRGSKLLSLIQEGATASEFQLHVGSDGAPERVLDALSNVVAPWTMLFESGAPSSRHSSRVM